jgi:hypothetical protein
VHPDCDQDSLIYLGEPVGPSCHTGAGTCWFERVHLCDGAVTATIDDNINSGAPRSTLLALEATIAARKREAGSGDGVLRVSVFILLISKLLCHALVETCMQQNHELKGKNSSLAHKRRRYRADKLKARFLDSRCGH